MLEFVFSKVADLKGLQHRCFPSKFEKFLRTLILKSRERLLSYEIDSVRGFEWRLIPTKIFMVVVNGDKI